MTTIAGPWEPSLRLSCKTVRGGGLSGPGGGDGSGGNEGGPAILVMSTSRSRNSAVSRAPVQSTKLRDCLRTNLLIRKIYPLKIAHKME